jgi:hypothetical protein
LPYNILLVVAIASAIFMTACDDSSPEDACHEIVEAIAQSWNRCGWGKHDDVKKTYAEAFDCPSVKNSDSDKVDKCVSDLNAQVCGMKPELPSTCAAPCPASMTCPPGPISY